MSRGTAPTAEPQEAVESRRSKRKQEKSNRRNNPAAKKPKTSRRNQLTAQSATREQGGSLKTRTRRQINSGNETGRIDEEDPRYEDCGDDSINGNGARDRTISSRQQNRRKPANDRLNDEDDVEDHQLPASSSDLEKIRGKLTGEEFGIISKAIQQSQQLGKPVCIERMENVELEDRGNGLEGHDLDDDCDDPQDRYQQEIAGGDDSHGEEEEDDDDDVLKIDTGYPPREPEDRNEPERNPDVYALDADGSTDDVDNTAGRNTEFQSVRIANSSRQVSSLCQVNAVSSGPMTTSQSSIDESVLLNALKSLHSQTEGVLKSELKTVVSEMHG